MPCTMKKKMLLVHDHHTEYVEDCKPFDVSVGDGEPVTKISAPGIVRTALPISALAIYFIDGLCGTCQWLR